mmetsp:Transcript_7441/g.20692  ORF Transcript_7441/g.20692 Transcript_7441/m.20692 type:complete len:462 (+) Transcript_7441:255-1640(+)
MRLAMNPYLNWSTTASPQQPKVLDTSSCPTCTASTAVITPRSSGTATAVDHSSSVSAMSSSPEARSPTDAATATTKSYRRPRPVPSAVLASDQRDSLIDRIAVMRQQEGTFPYTTCDYFALSARKGHPTASPLSAAAATTTHTTTTAPDAACRAKMVDWCTQVIDYIQFSRETVAVAMSYVDRYLSTIATAISSPNHHRRHQHFFTAEQRAPLHDRKEYQLLCMAALHTAIKIREPLEMDTELVAELSRGTYTAADVAFMEQQLLIVLGWRVAGPTGLDFCRHLIELTLTHGTNSSNSSANNKNSSNADRIAEAMVDLCRYQTELAAADYRFVTLKPSTVAVSACLNAIEALGDTVIAPTERLVVVETIRRVTKIDPNARAVRTCREELMIGLAGVEIGDAGTDLAKLAVQQAATDSSDSSGSSTGSSDNDSSGNKLGRRESIGSSAEESPISVAVHSHRA